MLQRAIGLAVCVFSLHSFAVIMVDGRVIVGDEMKRSHSHVTMLVNFIRMLFFFDEHTKKLNASICGIISLKLG